jgi:hypothetical protein
MLCLERMCESQANKIDPFRSFADLRRERGGPGAEQPESSERRGVLNTPLSAAKAEHTIPAYHMGMPLSHGTDLASRTSHD